jgi:hypothetical protein
MIVIVFDVKVDPNLLIAYSSPPQNKYPLISL